MIVKCFVILIRKHHRRAIKGKWFRDVQGNVQNYTVPQTGNANVYNTNRDFCPLPPRKHWERWDTYLLSFDSSVFNAWWGNAIQNSNSLNL